MYLATSIKKPLSESSSPDDRRYCNPLTFFTVRAADALSRSSLGPRPDDFCLRFSRAIADEWPGEFIDRSYIRATSRRLPRNRKDRSSGVVDRFCMRAPQVPSHALTNRDVKQMFRADLSLGLRAREEESENARGRKRERENLTDTLSVNHADRSPFGARSSNATRRSYPRKRGG